MSDLIDGMDLARWLRVEGEARGLDASTISVVFTEVLERVQHPARAHGDYRYAYDGEVFRVVVAGDLVALPNEEWSYGGFGQSISEEWLLGSGNCRRFPGKSKARRRLLAYFIRRALAAHHGYSAPAWDLDGDEPRVAR